MPFAFALLLLVVWGWFGAVAELFWAFFLRPWLVATVAVFSLAISLGCATALVLPPAALIIAAFVSPLFTWTLLNLGLWLRCPAEDLNELRSLEAFCRLRWRDAFFELARRRQRDSYTVPIAASDEAEL